jgi:hypothetical protein
VFEKVKSLFDLKGKNILIVSLTIKPVAEALSASKASAAPVKGAFGPPPRRLSEYLPKYDEGRMRC